MKSNLKRIEAALLCALLFTQLYSMTVFCKGCENIRDSLLRLHVVANSDSECDQALKLKIRDAVLERGANIFDGSVDADSAEEKITPMLGELKSAARQVVRENGFDYDVNITVGEEYFETRTYGDITVPAGKYRAVIVTVGSGKGHNWWCVMFPPLCLPSVSERSSIDTVLNGNGLKTAENGEKYEIRFKAIELFEKLRK